MCTPMAVLSRLHLSIQRLMDADLLLEEEATELLAQVEAALHSPDRAAEEALAETIQPLLVRLAPLIEARRTGADLPDAPRRRNIRSAHRRAY